MITGRLRRHPKAARNASSVGLLAIGVLALYNWVLAPHVSSGPQPKKKQGSAGERS